MEDQVNGVAPATPLPTLIKLPGTDKTYDLAHAFPLTLGDWAVLEEANVIDDQNRVRFTAKTSIVILTHLLKKLDQEVTAEQVGRVPLDTLAILGQLMAGMAKRTEEAIARPISPPS